MYSYEVKLRVQYYETDQMGVVHHSNYIRYYETARTELMRSLGVSYHDMEASGIMMPIISASSKYIQPALYDEEITVKAIVKELPTSRIRFFYEIYNQTGKLINEGETLLAFVNMQTQRPVRAPELLTGKLVHLF